MNTEIIKTRFNNSVKRALTGELSSLDIKNIIRYQCREYGELSEMEVALIHFTQVNFN